MRRSSNKSGLFGQVRVALFAQVQEPAQFVLVQPFGPPARDIVHENQPPVFAAQQDRRQIGLRQNGMVHRQAHQAIQHVALHQRFAAPQNQRVGLPCGDGRAQRRIVTAQLMRPIQRRASECHRFRIPHRTVPPVLRNWCHAGPAQASTQISAASFRRTRLRAKSD